MVAKRRGQSAAFMARIRKLRGKKKTAKRKPISIKSHRRLNMAKKRIVRRRKSSTGMKGITATAAGVGGYILFESMIEPKIIQMANITNPIMVNVAELVAGMWASKKSGVLGQVGKAAIVVNVYQILHPYLSTLGSNANSNGVSSLFS